MRHLLSKRIDNAKEDVKGKFGCELTCWANADMHARAALETVPMDAHPSADALVGKKL